MRSERHLATPKTGLPHAPTRGFGAPILVSPAIKIEIENSLEMALSKAKSGSAWQSHFWQCGTLRPARNTKLFTLRELNQSWFCSSSKLSNATGEDHFLESKKPMCFGPENEVAAVPFFAKNGAALGALR